ncbi:DUF2939 domain-containing protein [Phenylobacterium sp. LH3H17]|uniref:DUF2939 domain-containing protein n=1 Tax=Phenylobacterium sp. LH3H17 TaxID=2903901 RepID=UPI0020CA22F6|nr:DUF2939 domain-containing protein [Phenylobacterium sp. LH3H17]UTP40808.1 DUF2939 domain-containing protein [Phenylobacterium sp. LH3H17]
MDPRAPDGWSLGRAVFRLLLALIVGTALVFAAAPFFAFRALKAAARDGDAQALAELVDYRAVREGLRPQVAARPVAAPAPPDIWSDPIGAMRRAIEPLTPAPPAVEPYLDTRGLYDLTRGYAPGKAPAGAKGALPRLRYWGPNRARFAVAHAGAETPVIFSFQRRDLFAWKLVQIRVPPPV